MPFALVTLGSDLFATRQQQRMRRRILREIFDQHSSHRQDDCVRGQAVPFGQVLRLVVQVESFVRVGCKIGSRLDEDRMLSIGRGKVVQNSFHFAMAGRQQNLDFGRRGVDDGPTSLFHELPVFVGKGKFFHGCVFVLITDRWLWFQYLEATIISNPLNLFNAR